MDKFVIRTKLPPRGKRKGEVKEDQKKQATIESLAVGLAGSPSYKSFIVILA